MRIELTKPQSKVWNSKKRFKILLAGRRFGKSHLALAWVANNAQKRVGLHWYVAPSYQQAKDIAWRPIKNLLKGHVDKINESEFTIELKNGSIIQLKSADKPDSLHGVSLSSVVLDECRFFKEEVWEEGISPATSDKEADVLFISTPPEGFNWFTDMYENAKYKPAYEEDWATFQFTTAQGGNVSAKEIERARNQNDPKTFRRMYEATIENMGNRVYSEFDRDLHIREDIDPDMTNLPEIWVGMDFNRDPMTAVIGNKVGGELHIFDEFYIPDSDTYEMAEAILRKYPNRRVFCLPDPASRASSTATRGGVSNYFILENEYHFNVYAPKKHDSILDRVASVNAMFRSASGNPRLFIHPRCEHLIRSLTKQGFKEGSNLPDKSETRGYDHMNDALGYLVSAEYPIVKKLPDLKIKFAL